MQYNPRHKHNIDKYKPLQHNNKDEAIHTNITVRKSLELFSFYRQIASARTTALEPQQRFIPHPAIPSLFLSLCIKFRISSLISFCSPRLVRVARHLPIHASVSKAGERREDERRTHLQNLAQDLLPIPRVLLHFLNDLLKHPLPQHKPRICTERRLLPH